MGEEKRERKQRGKCAGGRLVYLLQSYHVNKIGHTGKRAFKYPTIFRDVWENYFVPLLIFYF